MQLFRGACADGRVRGLRNKQWLEFSAVLLPETPTLPHRNIDQARRSVLVLRKTVVAVCHGASQATRVPMLRMGSEGSSVASRVSRHCLFRRPRNGKLLYWIPDVAVL